MDLYFPSIDHSVKIFSSSGIGTCVHAWWPLGKVFYHGIITNYIRATHEHTTMRDYGSPFF